MASPPELVTARTCALPSESFAARVYGPVKHMRGSVAPLMAGKPVSAELQGASSIGAATVGAMGLTEAHSDPDVADPSDLNVEERIADVEERLAEASAKSPGKRPFLATAVYSLGFIVQRALGMALLPLYTHAVAPATYGVLGLLVSVGAALAIIFALGLDFAVMRTYFQLESQPETRERFIASVWRFLVVYPLVASVILCLAILPFPSIIAGANTLDIGLMLLATALAIAGTTVPLAVLRAKQDLTHYVQITAAVSLITPALTWLFVVELHQGVRGWFIAASIANAATFLVAAIAVPWRRHVRFDRMLVTAAVVFSLPLMPHFLSTWALQVLDRIVIAGMVSARSLGIYTLAANLAAPLFALLGALNNGFLPVYGRAGAEPGHEGALARTVKVQIAATITITLAASLLGRTAIYILTAPSYHAAGAIVVWLMLGYGFVGLYYVPMAGATIIGGRRMFAFVGSMSAAAINVLLLVLFVPSYGILAAAIADAAAYFALLVLMSIWAHSKPNPMTYDWRSIIVTLGLAGATYVGCTVTEPQGAWVAAFVDVLWLVAFMLALGVLEFPSQLASALRRLRPAVRGLSHG